MLLWRQMAATLKARFPFRDSPVDDDRVRGRLVAVSAALLVAAATARRSRRERAFGRACLAPLTCTSPRASAAPGTSRGSCPVPRTRWPAARRAHLLRKRAGLRHDKRRGTRSRGHKHGTGPPLEPSRWGTPFPSVPPREAYLIRLMHSIVFFLVAPHPWPDVPGALPGAWLPPHI